MKKTNILWIILNLIFLVIFNVFFFVLDGIKYNYSTWISYGFIHFAYFMIVFTPLLIRRRKSAAVFGFSLYSISIAYFLIELITGIIFIIISPEKYTVTMLVQLSIAGFYGIILISNMIANEHTANSEEKRQSQISFIKDSSVKLKGLMESTNDKDIKKKIEKAYDAISSSPVKSQRELIEVEYNIFQGINDLEDVIQEDNKGKIITYIDSLLKTINERNMRLNTLN